jgi:hypothetical protein
MVMIRRPVRRSLVQQAFALHGQFPGAKVKLTPTLLDWTDTIQPTAASRNYTVRITYNLRSYPEVRIIGPKLESRLGESLPHVFSDGYLCLHVEEDWTPDMLIVKSTVPWTSEWLIYYEIWKFAGTWYGGGEWPPRRAGDATTEADVIFPGSPTPTVSEPR